ncbi:MAG TPA: VWA domain-containing protein, partial [Candidatus Limnocylindrales bacterium]
MHISTHLDVDVVAVETDDEVSLLVELTAPAAAPSVDAVVHTAVVVLDRSGSMCGLRLEHAKRALIALVDRLDEHDRFGLVTFDDHAELVVPAEPVGNGRD